MRGRVAVVVVAVAALAGPSMNTSELPCEPTIVDRASMLTVSTRLDGGVEALRRDGVVPLIRTLPQGDATDHAVALAGRCRGLDRHDTDAVIVVLTAGGGVEVLPIGPTDPAAADSAERLIESRIASRDPDVTSALAEGIESLWESRGGRTEPAHATANPWAAARQRADVARRTAVAAVVVAAAALGAAIVRRRRATAAAVDLAQRCRAQLAEHYLDLDAAVIRATRTGGGSESSSVMAAVNDAAQRAGAVLLATVETRPRRAADARCLAAACTSADDALRAAIAAVGRVRPDMAVLTPVGFGAQGHERTGDSDGFRPQGHQHLGGRPQVGGRQDQL